ncbi:MAG: KamA family radical SAM protein [Thermodesulfobacteriota bacterium]
MPLSPSIHSVDELHNLSPPEREALRPVAERYPFRAPSAYLSRIDWQDPDDPLRRIVVPHPDELLAWGRPDPSDEASYTRAPGLQHKYPSTALLLVTDNCAGFCRHCFRKRLFTSERDEVARDLGPALDYIREHREITNVLLTGGDPLTLPTRRLAHIVSRVAEIPHVRAVRIGSKVPAYDPGRILRDPALAEMVRAAVRPDMRLYLMTQFNHPRELGRDALAAIHGLLFAGMAACNQTPILRGVNDDPGVLAQLFRQLSFAGIAPYYAFICRPTSGNLHLSAPVEECLSVFSAAQSRVSGLAKRARLVMSHSTGKVEVVGVCGDRVVMRYHRAAEASRSGKLFMVPRNPEARWLDDYFPAGGFVDDPACGCSSAA